jgi:hypothetical protein
MNVDADDVRNNLSYSKTLRKAVMGFLKRRAKKKPGRGSGDQSSLEAP